MKSFAQFLTESPKAVVLTDFPVIMSNPASQEKMHSAGFVLNRYANEANAAIQAGGVLKSGYKDLSGAANYVAEYAANMVDAKYKHGGRWENLPAVLRNIEIRPSHIGLVSSTLAKVESLKIDHPYRTEAIAMLKELLPVEALVGYFKNHIVAKQSKADRVAQAIYNAPPSMKQARELVANVLTHMTNEVKGQYITQLEEPWVEDLEEFFAKEHLEQLRHIGAHPDQDRERAERNAAARAKHKERFGRSLGFQEESRGTTFIERMLLPIAADIRKMGEADGIKYSYTGTQHPMYNKPVWTPKQNWKHLVHLEAVRQAEDMQQHFVGKNVDKLSSIVETKANIQGTPTILNVYCRRGVIEGNIRFNFMDGSVFTVRNKIVTKAYEDRSGHYATMYQYPTTFHDAKLPNGKRMEGQPSEREMNEIFAVAKG